MVSIHIVYGIAILTAICDSARILVVIPTPSISHQVVFRPFTLELAKRGHELVVITTDPIFAKGKSPVNYTEIDVHDISYDIWNKFVESSSGTADLVEQMKFAYQIIEPIFENQIQTNEVQQILKNEKFDLLIIESWVLLNLAFTHIYKIPTIQFCSFGPHVGICELYGASCHPLFYPLPTRKKIQNLTILDKVQEYYLNYGISNMLHESIASSSQTLKKMFGPNFPTIEELMNNVDMLFLNSHPTWDFNRPVPPNVIYLGGLHQSAPKKLPEDLKSYLDSSTNGVIYMSLGTNVLPSFLPRKTIEAFLKGFTDLPYNVLWKWDQDELKGKPENVNISKWFPQSDLLCHPNVKLFITQGGLQSTDESITAGVPLVGIPLIADQWYNVELYVYHKIGIKLDIETLKAEDLMNAIKTVLKDDSYRTNIVKLRTLMRDQPQTSLERAIWWTEYVLRHKGAKHLRSPAANISWAEYLELELVAVVLVTLTIFIVLLFFVTKFLWRLLLSLSKIKKD